MWRGRFEDARTCSAVTRHFVRHFFSRVTSAAVEVAADETEGTWFSQSENGLRPQKKKGKGNMKRLLGFASKLLVAGIVLLALSAPVSASQPEEVVFTFDLVITVPDAAAEGSFVAIGAIEDSGTVDETYRWTDEGILQGTMLLTGEEGTITLRFHLALLPPIVGPPMVVPTIGRFVVVSGTGAYENIHGVGTAESTVYVTEDPVAIDATFSGKVHVDP